MTAELCEAACSDKGLIVKQEGKSAKSLVTDIIKTDGLVKFLDGCSLRVLKSLHKNFMLRNSSKIEKELAQTQLVDEILLSGTQVFLKSISKEILALWANDLQIEEIQNYDKDKIIDSILVKVFQLEPIESFEKQMKTPKKEKTAEVEDDDDEEDQAERDDDPENEDGERSHMIKKNKRGRKRKDQESDGDQPKKKTRTKYKCPPLSNIKKGISKEDLHSLYNQTDLQQYCKKNGLAHAGKKAAIIKRIILFLETGQKIAHSPHKKGKKKKKRKVASRRDDDSDDDDDDDDDDYDDDDDN